VGYTIRGEGEGGVAGFAKGGAKVSLADAPSTVVASAAFAGIMTDGWTDLGEFPIAGFSRPQRVFGLRDEAAL